MDNVTRTIYSSLIQTCMLMKLPFILKENSTLNEKFGVQSGVLPNIDEMPAMRYFSIGNGGHRISVGANGIAKPEIVQHRATDAALYNHLPFVLREISNDLDVAERQQYALRRLEIHNGVQYIAYYLKRMDLTSTSAVTEYTVVDSGASTVTEFVPTSANLNPVPPALSNTGVNIISGDYASASAKIALSLSPSEITEMLNVARIIYDDEDYAIISEIALCSGIDKVVQSSAGGGNVINFNEAIAVQVCSFINTFFPLKFSNSGVDVWLDVGSTEPLYLLK